MKKSTKIIATAVALVLVVAAMVVGIYAATSAGAAISATVTWEAEAGLEFRIDAWTAYSAEHWDATTSKFPYVSPNKIEQIKVDTKTSNNEASSTSTRMQRTLDASFIDITDDGVNNPETMYYIYDMMINYSSSTNINVEVTKYPVSGSNIQVRYIWGSFASFDSGEGSDMVIGAATSYSEFSTTITTTNSLRTDMPPIQFIIELTVMDPDTSVTEFDASVGFSFTKAE